MEEFPSLKARRLLAVLMREPLNYRVVRQRGSHRLLRSPDYPAIVFTFHDRKTVRPGHVRQILTKDIGLTEEQARGLL